MDPYGLPRPAATLSANKKHHVLLLLFSFYVVLSIFLPLWKLSGMPVRSLVGLALLVLLYFNKYGEFKSSLGSCRGLLEFISYFGIVGALVSVLNGMSAPDVFQNVAEIYIQSIVNILLASIMIGVSGARNTLLVIIFPIAVSCLFAIGQYIGIEKAWSIREFLGIIQKEDFTVFFFNRRPMGLSLSPIILATQVCTAFAGFGIYRQLYASSARFDAAVLYAAAIFMLVCIASGNRSPLLGMLFFVCAYGISRRPTVFVPLSLIMSAFSIATADWAQSVLSDAGSRIGEFDDKSALGRFTLIYYGVRLFLAQPWGYGLGFDPTDYWEQYWTAVAAMPNPEVISRYPLHNYLLNMLNFYGIWIFFFFPKIVEYFKRSKKVLVFFLPYSLHIFFHNSGPLWNDAFIWLVIAAVAAGRQRRADFG